MVPIGSEAGWGAEESRLFSELAQAGPEWRDACATPERWGIGPRAVRVLHALMLNGWHARLDGESLLLSRDGITAELLLTEKWDVSSRTWESSEWHWARLLASVGPFPDSAEADRAIADFGMHGPFENAGTLREHGEAFLRIGFRLAQDLDGLMLDLNNIPQALQAIADELTRSHLAASVRRRKPRPHRDGADSESDPLEWPGVHDAALMRPEAVRSGHALADAARSGNWDRVRHLLDSHGDLNVNQTRPSGKSGFTILHQVAWHGAADEVVAEFIARGSLRSLPDSQGRLPQDVAASRGHHETAALLAPPPHPWSKAQVTSVQSHLVGLITDRITRDNIGQGRWDPHTALRFPLVAAMHEHPSGQIWFPVPNMYGGFALSLLRGYLYVSSWIRVVGGSGESHVVTPQGVLLVDTGFV